MTAGPATNWDIFRLLCRVVGGQDDTALPEAIAEHRLPQLLAMARENDVLHALALRCEPHWTAVQDALGEEHSRGLKQPLIENTLRNMKISAQALKLSKTLNAVGITPLFLKGTAQLLTTDKQNLGFRKQIDIDFIVRPEEILSSSEALLADGYTYHHADPRSKTGRVIITNTEEAINASRAHHHLPPMVKAGYGATLELHKHFLVQASQRKNPIGPLFASARQIEQNGASFQVPSVEYQLIHLVLGKLVNDGHLARRTFPIREGCDYISLMKSVKEDLDKDLIQRSCGKEIGVFVQLITDLMNNENKEGIKRTASTNLRIKIMGRRANSAMIAKLLNSHARGIHLVKSLLYSPAKMSTYLERFRGVSP